MAEGIRASTARADAVEDEVRPTLDRLVPAIARKVVAGYIAYSFSRVGEICESITDPAAAVIDSRVVAE